MPSQHHDRRVPFLADIGARFNSAICRHAASSSRLRSALPALQTRYSGTGSTFRGRCCAFRSRAILCSSGCVVRPPTCCETLTCGSIPLNCRRHPRQFAAPSQRPACGRDWHAILRAQRCYPHRNALCLEKLDQGRAGLGARATSIPPRDRPHLATARRVLEQARDIAPIRRRRNELFSARSPELLTGVAAGGRPGSAGGGDAVRGRPQILGGKTAMKDVLPSVSVCLAVRRQHRPVAAASMPPAATLPPFGRARYAAEVQSAAAASRASRCARAVARADTGDVERTILARAVLEKHRHAAKNRRVTYAGKCRRAS